MIQVLSRQYRIGLCYISNGRLDLMDRTIPYLREKILSEFDFDELVLVDDSANKDSWIYCDFQLPQFTKINHMENKGLAYAVNSAWGYLSYRDLDFILHIEDDFIFHQVPPLDKMVQSLTEDPSLSQMILKRNPVSHEEFAAGGYIEISPLDYAEYHSPIGTYITHNKFFSLNPGVIPSDIFRKGWPLSNERGMIEIMKNAGYKSAIWGRRTDPPLIEHIGHYRTAGWKE
jgi:hypothetical protein